MERKNDKRPRQPYSTGIEKLDAKIAELVAEFGNGENNELVKDIATTGFRLFRDNISKLDIKIINASLKEIFYAFSVFSKFRDKKKVSIFGSARTPEGTPDYEAAKDFGAKIAGAGYMVITGAGAGIMGAGNEGAGLENSFGVSIRLPFENETNPFIAKERLINFKYFFTRKLVFAKETDAIVLFPGGFGTLDEAFELLTLLQTGKGNPLPVIMLEAPGGTFWPNFEKFVKSEMLERGLISAEDSALYRICKNSEEAVAEIDNFYKNYHSIRFVADRLVLRMRREIPDDALAVLNSKFSDIVPAGAIEKSKPLAEEANENDLLNLPRLVFKFNKRAYARLRMLINEINRH